MKNIAIIMGGYSSEYKISLISGNLVYHYLDKTKYRFCVHILKEKWVYVDETKQNRRKNDFSVTVDEIKINFECVFNAIHGTPGEDGLMQAYLELLEIKPHVTITKQPLPSTKEISIRIKTIRHKSAVSYYFK
jgi:D-alanine-D-alanine ligase